MQCTYYLLLEEIFEFLKLRNKENGRGIKVTIIIKNKDILMKY